MLRKHRGTYFILLLAVLCSTAAAEQAIVRITPVNNSGVIGSVLIATDNDTITLAGYIKNLSVGFHGFHIHSNGDCTGDGANNAGGHFNPTAKPHGGKNDPNRHVGDLGNIESKGDYMT